MPNDYAKAHEARKKLGTPKTSITIEPTNPDDTAPVDASKPISDSEPGVAHPVMRGLYYGSKPIIKGVPQARGVVDRNMIDTGDMPIGPGYKPKQSKT